MSTIFTSKLPSTRCQQTHQLQSVSPWLHAWTRSLSWASRFSLAWPTLAHCSENQFVSIVFWPHPLPWRRSPKHLVDNTNASCQPLHLQAFQEDWSRSIQSRALDCKIICKCDSKKGQGQTYSCNPCGDLRTLHNIICKHAEVRKKEFAAIKYYYIWRKNISHVLW